MGLLNFQAISHTDSSLLWGWLALIAVAMGSAYNNIVPSRHDYGENTVLMLSIIPLLDPCTVRATTVLHNNNNYAQTWRYNIIHY